MTRPRPWPTRRGEVTLADVGEAVVIGFALVVAWFLCAGALGVFVGCVIRVANWMQP